MAWLPYKLVSLVDIPSKLELSSARLPQAGTLVTPLNVSLIETVNVVEQISG
jgi:hypothetical protein